MRSSVAAGGEGGTALERDLRGHVDGEVRFDAGSRAAYSTDASIYREVPVGVVIPRTVEDLVAAVGVCAEHDAPILPRGAGTSMAGQACNVAVVLDTSKYLTRVLEVDPEAGRARVEPGVVRDRLRDAAAPHGLTFAPDPSTHDRCVIGGMVGNDACGKHSVRWGRTSDSVTSLDVLLADGTRMEVGATSDEQLARILAAGGRRAEVHRRLDALRRRAGARIRERFPDLPRRVSGYALDRLLDSSGFDVAKALVGSEGTCVTVLGAEVELVAEPAVTALAVVAFPDVVAAARCAPDLLPYAPEGLEGLDRLIVDNLHARGLRAPGEDLLPPGGGWLLVEFGGETLAEAGHRAEEAIDGLGLGGTSRIVADPAGQRAVWRVREAGAGLASRLADGREAWSGWEDAAVPPQRLGDYVDDFRALLGAHGLSGALYGHFGDGCVHIRIDFDLGSEQGLATYRRFVEQAADLVVSHGGSLSGEHGDGRSRSELLERMYGPELVAAFGEFKAIFDPDGRMNPGRIVDPAPLDGDVRFGARDPSHDVATRFAYPADGGSFATAMRRCIGVGKCRKADAGTMCPSYMATGEEIHSTRGRARLLFEMLEGGPITDGWADEHVHEALELCLSCKACKTECPVNVDMATYKAEFLSHHHEHHRRSPIEIATGLIHRWLALGSRAPGVANGVATLADRSAGLKRRLGVAPQRSLPRLARTTFRASFARRAGDRRDGTPVMLWTDTFTDHLEPAVAAAAVEVLEDAGAAVALPSERVCCGRPLYDHGMLDRARRHLVATLDVVEPALRDGVPIVVLEPSCLSVFRDELPNLLPDDPRAGRLGELATSLAAYLERLPGYAPPSVDRPLLLHGHCHQEALWGTDDDVALLRRTGAEVEVLDSGCCGMAGAFGFDAEKYDVSVALAERVLLPAARRAGPEAVVVTDGFSCREQVAQLTGRRPAHTAEVLRAGLDAPG